VDVVIRSRRPIRVAHVVPAGFGRDFCGHTHYLYSLLSGWQDPDVSMSLIGTRWGPVNTNSGDLEYRLPATKKLWSEPVTPGRLDSLLEAARLPAVLVSLSSTFDIAHLHSLGWGSLLGSAAVSLLGRRVVATMSLYGDHNPSAAAGGKGGSLRLGLLRRLDGVVALSPALAEDCRRHGMSNVVLLPNFLAIPGLRDGSDPSLRDAVRSRYQIPAGAPVLLFVGSAIRRKGLDILIESYIRVAEAHPSTWLIMVGPCKEGETANLDFSYVGELRERLRRAHLSDRVIWTGMVTDRHAMTGYYSAADIFVFPTRREGSPNVVAEAMASELPVVMTRLPGVTEQLVAEGVNGYTTPQDDSTAVADAIERLVHDAGLRKSMGSEGRRKAIEMFSFNQYSRRLKDFYLCVMDSQS